MHNWISCFIHAPALQGKRSAIKTYLKEIHESVEAVADGGILDYVLSRILPVVTTLRAHSKPPPEEPAQQPADFDVTDKFSLAQKNETQWKFQKVKSAGKSKAN